MIPVPDPIPTPQPESDTHTDEEIEAEAQFADDLQAILDDAAAASLAYEIKHADPAVTSFINTLLDCVRDALSKRANGDFLSEEYIRTEYADTISELRSSYRAMTGAQQSEMRNIAIGFSTIEPVLDYVGYGDRL